MPEFDANYFSELASQGNNDVAQETRRSLLANSDANPDEVARASKLSREFGVPQEAVEEDISFYEKEKNFSPKYFTALSSQNPNLAKFLAERDNAKIVHDDVGPLVYTSDKMRSLASASVQFGSDVIGGTGEVLQSAAAAATEGVVRKQDYYFKSPLDRVLDPLSVGTTAIAGDVLNFVSEEGIDKLAEYIRPPEERRDFVDDVVSGLGQVASQLVLFARNPAMATGALFATGAEQQADRLDAEDVQDPNQRLLAQTLGGGVTAATERVQLGFLLNRVPGLKKILGKAPKEIQNKWLDRIVDVGTAAGAEATQEVVEGFLQDLIAQQIYKPDQEFFETIREEAATAGVVGAIARTAILAITGGRRASTYQDQANQAKALRESVIEAKQAGEGTKLLERDPEKFKEFLSNATEGQEITLDGAIVDEMYQSEQDLDKFFEMVPEARIQFAESTETGADVKIPADKLVYAMAQDANNELDFIADFVKLEDGITSKDADNPDFVNEQIDEVMRQAREEQATFESEQQQKEFYDRVEQQVYENLTDVGRMGEKARTPDVANQEAILYAGFVKSMIDRGGEPTRKVLENVFGGNFEIRGPQTQPPALPVTGEDAYIDSLRKKQKSKGLRKKKVKKDLLGEVRKPGEKATPKPLIKALIQRGKIRRGSPIQAELKAIGITPKAYPKLFAKDGALGDIDNIVASEFESEIGVSGIFAPDETGYVDRQELLDKLRDETFGNFIRTEEDMQAELKSAYNEEVLNELQSRGVDITKADNDTVKRALAEAAEEYASGTYYQAKPIKTDTEAFKNWFGDSKVVDENGEPLVVYHGTEAEFDFFDPKKIGKKHPTYSFGFHFTDSSKEAGIYAKDAGARILPLYLQIKNPLVIKTGLHASNYVDNNKTEIVKTIIDSRKPRTVTDDDALLRALEGDETAVFEKEAPPNPYDGIIVKGKEDVNYIAFKPEQIKSQFNIGTFDPADPRILYQDRDSKRGSIQFGEQGQRIINLFKGADESTLFHETGHLFLDIFGQIAADPDATQDIKDDYQAALKWMGVAPEADAIQHISKNINAEHETKDVQKGFEDVGKKSIFKVGGAAVQTSIREDAGGIYLNNIHVKEVSDLTKQKYGTGLGTNVLNALKDYSNKTGKPLYIVGAVKSAVPYYEKFTDLRKVELNIEIKGQVETIEDSFVYKPSTPIGVEQHEQWARGFEAYLYEGKAPSAKLRAAFDRFKMWLLNVYKNISGLDVKLDDNIRSVFDRMLATSEEIDALESNLLFQTNEKTLEMLNKAEREKYVKQQDKLLTDAKDKLFRKALRQKRRENTKWYKEQREKVMKEQEELLQKDALYRAIHLVTTGQDFDGNTVLDSEYKMSEKDVIELYGEKEIVSRLPRGSRTKGDGVDLRILAEMYGFDSPKILIDAMIAADPYKLKLQKLTDDEMIVRHGDMLNDGTIEREALEMVMTQNPELNFVELESISKKTGVEQPTNNDFKIAAKRAIAQQNVDNSIKPDKYYRAALRAEREYGKALAKEDFDAAAEAKRRVILNKYMFKEARDSREEVNKALERFQKLSKKPPRKKKPKIDPEYHEKIWGVLGAYNLGPRLTEAKKLKLELAAINEWIIEKENNEFAQLLVPPQLMEAQDKSHYRDLTLDEFRGLRDLVVNLETQGRRKLQYISEQEKRDLNELVDELELTADEHNEVIEKPLSKRQNERLSKKLGELAGAIDAVNTKASTITSQLDGGKYGVWTKTIFEPIQAAEIQKVIRSRDEMKNLHDIIDRHYGKDYKKKKMRLKLDEKTGVADYKTYVQTFMDEDFIVKADGVEETLTREMILTIAMHQGTVDNKAKLLDGYAKTRGWTQGFIDNALSNMTKRDWLFVQDTWNYMDSFWPEVSKIEAERYGYAPEKIEHEPLTVTTADGELLDLPGGYMRIKYDPHQDVRTKKESIAEVNKDMMIGANTKAQTKNGSTYERANNVERPIRLDMDVVSEHINEQVTFITMSEAVENVDKVLRKQKVQEAVNNYIGEDALVMMETWLQDTSSGGVMAGGVINGSLRALRSNYTLGRLGLRPMTALLQFSGLAQTAGDVGTGNMVRGLMQVFSRGNPYAISEEIKVKSAFMREREFTLTRDVSDALRLLTRPDAGKVSKAAASMLWPMQKMQEVVDAVSWSATYQKALNEGVNDAEAIRQADIAVARSQGSGLVSDLAAIERGTLTEKTQRQEWVKFATMFFSYFNAKYNVIKTKNIQYKNKEIGTPELAASYLMTFMLEGLISALIMGQLDFDKDDDEHVTGSEVATTIGMLTLQQTAATVPFVRDVAGAAQGFSSQGAAQAQIQNIGTFLGTFTRTAQKISEGEDVNWYSFTRGAVNTTNAVLPLPAGMINQLLRAAEKEAKGDDAQIIDYLVYRED